MGELKRLLLLLTIAIAIGIISYKVYDIMYYKNTSKANKVEYESLKENTSGRNNILDEWKDAISKEANNVKKQIEEITK